MGIGSRCAPFSVVLQHFTGDLFLQVHFFPCRAPLPYLLLPTALSIFYQRGRRVPLTKDSTSPSAFPQIRHFTVASHSLHFSHCASTITNNNTQFVLGGYRITRGATADRSCPNSRRR